MKSFGLTIFSGLVFLFVAFGGETSPEHPFAKRVSGETTEGDSFRETVAVKHGVSQDGKLVIELVGAAPLVPPHVKYANRERTLRAFFATNPNGVYTLYVERAVPHTYYSVMGDFSYRAEYPSLFWEGDDTVIFFADQTVRGLTRYAVDLAALTIEETPYTDVSARASESLP